MHDGLHLSGLKEGIDYEVTERNAQGDMSILNTLVDAGLTSGVDLFIPISTPALQAAIQRGRKIPIVFTYVANPIPAGAGKTDQEHLPWVTGVYTMSDFYGMINSLKMCLPNARRIATLFCPAEVNSVFYRDELGKEAQKAGIELNSLPANTSVEIPDAAVALCSQDVDAICQISDNLTSAGYAAIVQAANQAGKPLFVFQSSQVEAGAVLGVSRDFEDAGRDAGTMAARVIRGESPAQIPFQPAKTTKLIINIAVANRLKLKISESLLSRADKIIRR